MENCGCQMERKSHQNGLMAKMWENIVLKRALNLKLSDYCNLYLLKNIMSSFANSKKRRQ